MSCSNVFDSPSDEERVRVCPNCKSAGWIVEVKQNSSQPKPTSNSSSSSLLSSNSRIDRQTIKLAVVPEDLVETPNRALEVNKESKESKPVQDVEKINLPASSLHHNLVLYLRLNFFKGGSTENPVYMLTTKILRYGNRLEEESEHTLLLTNKYIYFLKNNNDRDEDDYGFELVHQFHLHSLKSVFVALFFQFFRLDFSDGSSFVVLTRNHSKTHVFVNHLEQLAMTNEEG